MTSNENQLHEPSVGEQLVNLAAFARRALRFWRVLAATWLVGALAFLVFLQFRQPKYRSETVILYVEKTGAQSGQPESRLTQQSVTARLQELLFARPNLEKVIERFDLYPELRARYGMIDAIEELRKHVEFRAPGGDTFSIAFEGKSPHEAQAATAQLARQIIQGDTELRKAETKLALDFLAGERKSRDAALREAEEKLAAFIAEHPRFALDTTPLASGAAVRATLGVVPSPSSSAAAASPWLAVAPAPGKAASRAAPVTRSAPRVSHAAPTPSKPPPEVARAAAALAAAREDLAEKLVHYTPAHPDVRRAQAEVERATRRLAAVEQGQPEPEAEAEPGASEVARSAAPAPRRVAQRPSPAPLAANAMPEVNEEEMVGLETQWLNLTRAVTEARQRLDQVEAQLFRVDIQSSSQSGGHAVQVSVIDPAYLPRKPQPPGKTTLGLLFIAGATLLGAAIMLLCAAFSQRVFVARELNAVAEVLAEIPKRSARRAHVAT